MSDGGTPHFKIVCEGPTDFHVIDAVIAALMGEADYVRVMIQPESSDFAGQGTAEMGRGWKGVRKWCGQRLRDLPLGGIAALIIHLDADTADDDEVACAQPCPPAAATTDALRNKVLEWSGLDSFDDKVVLCTPSKSTEAWVLCALHQTNRHVHPDIECRPEPQAILVGLRPRLVRRKRRDRGTDYQKDTTAYKNAVPRIAANWWAVRLVCTEAERFNSELSQAISNVGA